MADIADLLTRTRFPPGFMFVLMILYFPIGVFLIVCRVLIAAHCFIILCLYPKNSARRHTLRAMLGVLGIQVMVDDDQSSKTSRPFIVVANYTSVLDHFIIDVVINNIVPYDHDVPAIFWWVLGYKDLGSSQGKQQFQDKVKKFIHDSELPVLFHPEDLPTNNTGLLKFSSLPFEFEIPVQPVSVQLSRLSFPCALTTMNSPKWSDVLWCFFAPITVFRLKVLPLQTMSEDETASEFADRVQGLIAESLGVPATQYTAAEVKEYVKRLKTPPPGPPRRVPKEPVTGGHGISQLSGSCLDSLDVELRKMVQQVRDVLPQVPVSAVKQDLEVTKDVDITISNLLEGRVPYEECEDDAIMSNNTDSAKQEYSSLSFKDSSFSRNPSDRHLSFEERKKRMYETARLRYKQKHKLL